MPRKPQTIFFDLGKVLVDYDFGIAYKFIEERSALSAVEFGQRIPAIEELNVIYETGGISTKDFFKSMAQTLEFDGSMDALALGWSDIFKPLPKNVEIARRLSEHYPLAIISNTSDTHIQFLEANYTLFEHFEQRIYSHVFGARKPSAEIYKHALERTGATAEQSLFIDDRIENVEAAVNLGWKAIHLNESVNLSQSLTEFGI